MKSIPSLLILDKNTKSNIKIELRKNLFFLLFVPLSALLLSVLVCVFFSDIYYEEAGGSHFIEEFSSFIPAMLGLFCTGMAAIMAFRNYRFLYNRRMVDLFQALPVSRNTQIFSKSVPALLSIVLAFLGGTVFPFFYVLFLRLRNLPLDFHKKDLLLSSLVTLLSVIVSYFLFQLIAVCAGKGWHYLLLLALSCFADDGFSLLLRLPSEQIAGFGMKSASFASAFLPSYALAFVPTQYGIGYGTVACGLVLVGAALYLLTVYHYRKRQNECAQASLGTPFIVALLGGGTAMELFAVLKTPADFAFNILIGVVGSFVLFVLLCLIFYKKAFKKIFLIEFGVLGACMVALVVVCGTNGLGWSDRLPTAESIEYVTIKNTADLEFPSASLNTYSDAFTKALISLDDSYYDEENIKTYTLRQKESVQTVLSVNRLANKDYRRHNPNDNTTTLLFEYHLKNGRVRTRHLYYAPIAEEDITYLERIEALQEARENLVKKYDLKKYSPVISFGELSNDAKMRINDEAMLQDIYNEYLAMSYEQALEACSANIDNLCVSIAFVKHSNEAPKDVVNEWYGDESYWDDETKNAQNITFSLLPSCKKCLAHCMRLNSISGFASLKDVSAANVDSVCKINLYPDYIWESGFFSEQTTGANEDIFWLNDTKAHSKNVFGRFCFSSVSYGARYHFEQKADSATLQTILKHIDTSSTPQVDEYNDSNYAIYFILKDGRITPTYFITGAPLLAAEQDDAEIAY